MFGSQLNRIRNSGHDPKNFSSNALKALLSAPEELMGQAKFNGTRQEAIDFVTMRQVDRGHWNSQEKEYFYVKRAEALGVQSRGGNGNNQYQSGNPQNCGIAPSAKEHADALGVQSRGGDRGNQYQSGNMQNCVMAPSAKEHADAFPH